MPPRETEPFDIVSSMLWMAALLFVVAIGIRIVQVVRRQMLGPDLDAEQELAESFQEAFEAGEIDAEEYRRIQDSLRKPPAPRPIPPATEASRPASEPKVSPSLEPDSISDSEQRPADD